MSVDLLSTTMRAHVCIETTERTGRTVASTILRFGHTRVCGSEVSILRLSVQFASADESVDLRTTAGTAATGEYNTRSGADNPLLRKALRHWKRDLNWWMFMAVIREKQPMSRMTIIFREK